jgi:predicted phosphodiesterase
MMERRDFITGMLAGAGFASGCRMVSPFMGGESARLKFGVVSDVHVKLAADGRSLAPGYDTQTLEQTFTYFRDCGVDAVMIAGDIADIGFVSELKAVADTWFKVFPGDRAPDGRKVERLFVFGNHDAYALQKGGDIFKDPKVLQREAIEADPQKAWDYCFHEEWSPYFKKTVKGFDFFCSHWQSGVWCNGYAETGCSGCADAFRSAMEKCDPAKPFFYVQHPHPRDTVYGRDAWGVDDGTSTRLLSAFPQAVAFSGHSHEPLTNERAIWRGAFTSVATGSLRYLSANSIFNRADVAGYENGGCDVYAPNVNRADRGIYYARYNAPKSMSVEATCRDIRVGQIVSVYDDRIEFEKREFLSGMKLSEDWVVELPAKAKSFAVRAKSAKTAEFPAGAKISAVRTSAKTRGLKRNEINIEPEEKAAIRFEFPPANVGGRVAEYEISAANSGGSEVRVRICATGGLYPKNHTKFSKNVVATVFADRFPVGTETFLVTPLDSFGNAGKALSCSLKID